MSAQQFALDDDDDNLKNEVKKSGFVTSAGYKAMLQQMVVNKEMNNESIHKDICHDIHDGGGSRRRRRPTSNRLGSMISSGSSILSASIRFGSTRSSTASSTLSTRTSLTNSDISRRSWPHYHNLDISIISFDDKLDISGDINIASTDNLAPRKLSGTETSLTQSVNTIQQEIKKYKPRSTRRRPFDKKLSSVDFDPKEVDNVTQNNTMDVNVRQTLKTEMTGDEKEVDFDPQAFLDDLLKKKTQPLSCAITKESEEWLPWPTSKSTSSSNEEDHDGSSISLSSSSSGSLDKDDIKDDCWLSWPKVGVTTKPSKSSKKKTRRVIRSARAA